MQAGSIVKRGDPVEVHVIVAGGPLPISSWLGSYTFFEYEPYSRSVLVHTEHGGLVRYAEHDVRLQTGGGITRSVRWCHEVRQAIAEADRTFAEVLS